MNKFVYKIIFLLVIFFRIYAEYYIFPLISDIENNKSSKIIFLLNNINTTILTLNTTIITLNKQVDLVNINNNLISDVFSIYEILKNEIIDDEY